MTAGLDAWSHILDDMASETRQTADVLKLAVICIVYDGPGTNRAAAVLTWFTHLSAQKNWHSEEGGGDVYRASIGPQPLQQLFRRSAPSKEPNLRPSAREYAMLRDTRIHSSCRRGRCCGCRRRGGARCRSFP